MNIVDITKPIGRRSNFEYTIIYLGCTLEMIRRVAA